MIEMLNLFSSTWCLFYFCKRKMRLLLHFPKVKTPALPFLEPLESTPSSKCTQYTHPKCKIIISFVAEFLQT